MFAYNIGANVLHINRVMFLAETQSDIVAPWSLSICLYSTLPPSHLLILVEPHPPLSLHKWLHLWMALVRFDYEAKASFICDLYLDFCA